MIRLDMSEFMEKHTVGDWLFVLPVAMGMFVFIHCWFEQWQTSVETGCSKDRKHMVFLRQGYQKDGTKRMC